MNSISSGGPIVFTYVLSPEFCVRKRILDFQFKDSFFILETLKVSPRRDVCLQTPVGVQLFLLMFYPPKGRLLADSSRGPIVFYLWIIWLRKGILDFQFTGGNSLLWNLDFVYPPKGLCKADAEGGPIVFTYILFCIRKRILDFQYTSGFLPFWDLENVLLCGLFFKITLYTCFFEKVWWVWVLVWFYFQLVETYSRSSLSTNPPKGLCKADTEGGSIGGEAAGRAKRG